MRANLGVWGLCVPEASCVKFSVFAVELEPSTRHTGFPTHMTWGVPVPVPVKTRTLSAGTGFWRVQVRVALNYPRVTRANVSRITISTVRVSGAYGLRSVLRTRLRNLENISLDLESD